MVFLGLRLDEIKKGNRESHSSIPYSLNTILYFFAGTGFVTVFSAGAGASAGAASLFSAPVMDGRMSTPATSFMTSSIGGSVFAMPVSQLPVAV